MTAFRLPDWALCLGRRRTAPARRRAAPPPSWFGAGAEEAPATDAPAGAGWFESSAELRRGLAVIELDRPLQDVAETMRATVRPSSITASA